MRSRPFRCGAIALAVATLVGGGSRAEADPVKAGPVAATPAAEAVAGEILALDVHQAARFVSLVYRCAVLVTGGEADAVRLHLAAPGGEVAKLFGAIASAGHLVVGQKDGIWVLVPPALADWIEGPRRSLPPGARLDLDLTLVAADDLVRVLAQALRLSPDGHVGGRVTVRGDKLPSLKLVGLVTRLAGREASRHDRRLVVGERLPDAPPTPPPSPCDPHPRGEVVVGAVLRCVDPGTLEVVAWAARGDARWAVVRVRPTAPGQPPVLATVTRGDGLGSGDARVQAIDATGITLSDEKKVPLVPTAKTEP